MPCGSSKRFRCVVPKKTGFLPILCTRNQGPFRSSNGRGLEARSEGGDGCLPGRPELVGAMFSVAARRFDDRGKIARAENVDGSLLVQPIVAIQKEEKLPPTVGPGFFEERKNLLHALNRFAVLVELNLRE